MYHAVKSPESIKDKVHLSYLFERLRALIALNCSLIFVTDGSVPSIKLPAYRQRLRWQRGLGSKATLKKANVEPKPSLRKVTRKKAKVQPKPKPKPPLRRYMFSEFSCMIREAKVLGYALGIPCLNGLEEAEAQCAMLNSEALCDGCFSIDSDIFLFGARTVYRDIIIGEGGYVVCYEMADIEKKLGFGRNSLIALALLLGGDYSQRVPGYGPKAACQLVKSIEDDKILHKVKSEGLAFARKNITTKKTTNDLNCDANKENDPCNTQCTIGGQETMSYEQFLLVINAYMKPKCHLPDSDAVQRSCSQYPFTRTELQRLCAKFFGWSPDKTDEYVLPTIAERDLRRFANLRSTSSKLGAQIPLDKMPVPCPVSAIVKQIEVEGIDCFEVSWQGMEGLQTSVVSADLVESACPEKIAEFMENECEAKNKQSRKSSPRKSTKADMVEVDAHLKALMLDIESQSNTVMDTMKRYGLNDQHNVMRYKPFIGLTSPSPPLGARKLVRHQESIDALVDVSNICKSDHGRR